MALYSCTFPSMPGVATLIALPNLIYRGVDVNFLYHMAISLAGGAHPVMASAINDPCLAYIAAFPPWLIYVVAASVFQVIS